MPLDASVITANAPQFNLQSPLEAQKQMIMLRQLGMQEQMTGMKMAEAQRGIQEQQALARIYAGNVGAGGVPNHEGIVSGMASNNLGHLIPKYRQTMLDADKDAADVASKKATTAKETYDLNIKKLDHGAAAITSLLNSPNLSHEQIIKAITDQVKMGYMEGQQGAQLVGTLPPNPDPNVLKQFLKEKLLATVDAKTRLEATSPKFEKIDNGGAIMLGSVDPMTGQWRPDPNGAIKKVATPDEILKSNTSLTTTGMNNKTSMRNTDVMANVQSLHAEQTPTGFVVVDKRNPATSKVVVNQADGSQVQQKDSPLWKSQQASQKLTEAIKQARELIPNATGSGVGAAVDKGLGLIGAATPGGDAAGQLEAIGGWMTTNVPRMEGPQSDNDTKVYRQMAAQVGDRTIPTSVRLKALETLETLTNKYAKIATNPVNSGGGARPPLSAFQKP